MYSTIRRDYTKVNRGSYDQGIKYGIYNGFYNQI